jgi:hypothetical protein
LGRKPDISCHCDDRAGVVSAAIVQVADQHVPGSPAANAPVVLTPAICGGARARFPAGGLSL